jgi:uncharacterized protein (UPF0264 family)
MQLLVSVANADDARAALAGGADFVDAKDPSAGALGAVSLDELQRIAGAVAGERPATAALGDAIDESAIECLAQAYTAAGASLVKVGFNGVSEERCVGRLLAAAVRGARSSGAGVIAVAYADADSDCAPSIDAIVRIAALTGARGVLLDTARKDGPGLRGLITVSRLASWVASAHAAGLLVALAGRLTADDLVFVRDAGADIAGVRGAACEKGRTSRVVAEKVRLLRAAALTFLPSAQPIEQ